MHDCAVFKTRYVTQQPLILCLWCDCGGMLWDVSPPPPPPSFFFLYRLQLCSTVGGISLVKPLCSWSKSICRLVVKSRQGSIAKLKSIVCHCIICFFPWYVKFPHQLFVFPLRCFLCQNMLLYVNAFSSAWKGNSLLLLKISSFGIVKK